MRRSGWLLLLCVPPHLRRWGTLHLLCDLASNTEYIALSNVLQMIPHSNHEPRQQIHSLCQLLLVTDTGSRRADVSTLARLLLG